MNTKDIAEQLAQQIVDTASPAEILKILNDLESLGIPCDLSSLNPKETNNDL